MRKRILLGMSGGVDSSVSVYILKELGYEVIGVYLDFTGDRNAYNINDAKSVANKLDIKFVVEDVSKEFNEIVIKYFVDEYNRGNTPSPCIICDEQVKFQKLFEYSKKYNCEYIATGHYAKIEHSQKYGEKLLIKGDDPRKDQSYMLYRLKKEIREKVIFPLGEVTKIEVREIAEKLDLVVKARKDSQGICFAQEGYIPYLQRKLGEEISEGDFTDENGNFIAKHRGFQFYTIGQRRGLGLNTGNPYFIINIIPEENRIILGDFEKLKVAKIKLEKEYIISPIKLKERRIDVNAKPRFSSQGHPAEIYKEENSLIVEYKDKNAENSRGQHVVFYDDKYVIGGGIIS